MKPSNLILNVTYWQDSPQFSGILNHLLGYSPDMGIIPSKPYLMHDTTYESCYFHNAKSGKKANFRSLYNIVSAVNESANPQEEIITQLSKYNDFKGTPVFESDYKFVLPRSVNYKPFCDGPHTLINGDYTSAGYIGLMEHTINCRSWMQDIFNNQTSLDSFDTVLNEDLGDDYFDLRDSANYCKTILEHIIKIKNESIDISDAYEYFFDKPIAVVKSAIDYGMEYVMNNGYDVYKELMTKKYVNETRHKLNTTSIKLKTLMLPVPDISYIAYEKLYDTCGIAKNDEAFHKWHNYIFQGDKFKEEESVEALVNIISKTFTGKAYRKDSWTMTMAAILEVALEEKQGIQNGLQTYPKYAC